MNDTPRTDEDHNFCKVAEGDTYRGFVTLAFARQLECELAAANERIRRLIDAGDAMAPMLTCDYRSDDAFRNWTQAKGEKP